MIPNEESRCGNCIYFLRDKKRMGYYSGVDGKPDHTDGMTKDVSYCMRFPPTAALSGSYSSQLVRIRPVVRAEEYCGEWIPETRIRDEVTNA